MFYHADAVGIWKLGNFPIRELLHYGPNLLWALNLILVFGSRKNHEKCIFVLSAEEEEEEEKTAMASSICRFSHRSFRQTPFFSRRLHEGPDTIDELLDRHLAKKDPKRGAEDEEEGSLRRSLTSTRREALSLYRDVLRASRFFTWPDSRGVPWREILRENARKEFEEARFETDPEVVTKLLIGGREAVQDAVDKLAATAKKMADKEAEERSRGRR